MGGYGSGNHWRVASRDTCEHWRRIDLRFMRRKGMLAPGYFGSLSWNRGGEPSGSIRFKSYISGVELTYRYRHAGADQWKDVCEKIPLVETRQHFGGHRQWFLCLSCESRCVVLYGGTHYRCRKCWRLAYQSQREPGYARVHSQAQKIRQRLGGSLSLDEAFPDKPKGMHWRTYSRLRAKGEALEETADAMFVSMFAQWGSLGEACERSPAAFEGSYNVQR